MMNIEQYSETEVQIIINNISIFMIFCAELRDKTPKGLCSCLLLMGALQKFCNIYLKYSVGLMIKYVLFKQIKSLYYKFKEGLRDI